MKRYVYRFRFLKFLAILTLLGFSALSAETPVPEFSLPPNDYDGDGYDDLAVFRPQTSQWFIRLSGGGRLNTRMGAEGDIPVPADYDGDGKANFAVFRPSTATWFIRLANGQSREIQFGNEGDIPVPADYNGDDKADISVFRPVPNRVEGARFNFWSYRRSDNSNTVSVNYGIEGDVPVPADYDGDGRVDLALFRPANEKGANNTFFYRGSRDGVGSRLLGIQDDQPVPDDYDGDGKADMAVFRPSTRLWLIHESGSNQQRRQLWGAIGDLPVPGKYDPDPENNKADIAIFRRGEWYILQSSGGSASTGFGPLMSEAPVLFGARTDKPFVMDMDGDGFSDPGVFRPKNGKVFGRLSGGGNSRGEFGAAVEDVFEWNSHMIEGSPLAAYNKSSGVWRILSPLGVPNSIAWGGPTFDPVPGDYDGDERMDIAVYRRTHGTWHIRFSGGGSLVTDPFGGQERDVPLTGDFDGDGVTDRAIYRDGDWFFTLSDESKTQYSFNWGMVGDIPLAVDFSDNGFTDSVVYRPSNGTWFVRQNNGPSSPASWFTVNVGGLKGDIPVPGDFDGDGVMDAAVFRSSSLPFGRWFIRESSSGRLRAGQDPIRFGSPTDIPGGQRIATVKVAPKLDELIGERGPGGGFIWKPVSEGDHKLVVLLPASLTDGIRVGWIADEEGQVVEVGRFTTASHNGGREHYRFNKKGSEYGNNLYVVSRDGGGNLIHWPIPNGANRYDY